MSYARIISRILDYYGVDLTNEFSISITNIYHEINVDVINTMGIYCDVSEQKYKHKSDALIETFAPTPAILDISTVGSSFIAPDQEEEITNQMIMDELQTLRGYMTNMFNDMKLKIF